jgi:uncharacterized protein (UPF0248 family)
MCVDEVIHRINWDQSLDPDKFRIVYLDRFQGNMETDYNTFFTHEGYLTLHYITLLSLPYLTDIVLHPFYVDLNNPINGICHL